MMQRIDASSGAGKLQTLRDQASKTARGGRWGRRRELAGQSTIQGPWIAALTLMLVFIACSSLPRVASAQAEPSTCVQQGGTALCQGVETTPWVYTAYTWSGVYNLNAPWTNYLEMDYEDFLSGQYGAFAALYHPCAVAPMEFGAWTPSFSDYGVAYDESQAATGDFTFASTDPTPCQADYGGLTWGGTRTESAYCESGYSLSDPSTAPYYCIPTASPKNLGECVDCKNKIMTGDPVNIGTGNVFEEETDYVGSGPFPLTFSHSYNSNAASLTHWRHNYGNSILVNGAGTSALAYRPDGKVYQFTWSGSQWTTDADVVETLTSTGTGYTYKTADDWVETYDTTGKLLSIQNRAGVTQTLTYNTYGQLQSVSDPFGHELAFTYNGQGQIATMTDPAGGVYQYTYDTSGLNNLASIQYPDSTTRETLHR